MGRRVPRRGLRAVPVARHCRGVHRVRQQRRSRSRDRPLSRPGHSRRRQRLRHVPRHRVHRRPLAAELADVACRQHPRRSHRTLPHVGQRLVQRSVRVLVRTVGSTGERRWICGTRDPAPRRDARRGHAVPGQPRSAPALPELVAHRHRWRNEPRQQPVRRSSVCGRRRCRLPHRRHAAGAGRGQLSRCRVPAGP